MVAHEWLARTWANKWLAELCTTASALAAVRTFGTVHGLRTVNVASEAPRLGMTQPTTPREPGPGPGSRGVAGQGLLQATAGVVGLPVPRKPNCAEALAFSAAL